MLAIIIAVVLIVIDQLTKLWIVRHLMPVQDIAIWDGVLHLHFAKNTGAAFSMLEGMQWLFSSIAIIACIGIIIYIFTRKHKMHWMALVSAGLIMAGAIGNLIDRIRLGYVIDFVYVKIINFAIFNVADSCITVGAVLLSVYILWIHEKYELKMKESTANDVQHTD